MKGAITDTSINEPQLSCYLCLGTVNDMPESSSIPAVINDGDWGEPTEDMVNTLKETGFEGVQGGDAVALKALGLPSTCAANIHQPGQIYDMAAGAQQKGYEALTLHVGTGMEDDDAIDRLIEDVVMTADKLDYPISIETHRATITQDFQRTVKFIERHPDVRFNGDFSHWYTGLEMVYGDWDAKMEFIQPVFDRITHMHGRIGNPGCIQVPLTGHEDTTYVGHFKDIWTRIFKAFKANAAPNQKLVFAPELLFPSIYYAPLNDAGQEMSDRWEDVLTMNKIVRDCWAKA